jgi:phage/plasmid-like protein (TIGR03299 family)
MLDGAGLARWNVRLEDITLPEGYTSIADSQLVVRDNPVTGDPEVLSVVGDRYKVVQNEALFDFGDAILDGGADWESAGSFKSGKLVYGSLTVPKEFILDPQGANDKTTTYLLVSSSHDGSSAVTASITPVRVWCQNTLNLAIRKAKQQFKIRHTQTVDGRLQTAREALNLTFDFMDKFEIEARQMFETTVTNDQFTKLVQGLYPEPDATASKVAMTRYNDKFDTLQDLWLNSPTNANITGTAWGALNALTERIDYYRDGRKGGEAIIASATGFDPVVNAEKNRIREAVLSLV